MKLRNRIKILKIKVKRRWQKLQPGEMFATYKKGKFVDVLKCRGGRVVMVSHRSTPRSEPGTMLLIPYQPNHGIMVEYIGEDGKSRWRNLMSYDDFYQYFQNSGAKEAKPQARL